MRTRYLNPTTKDWEMSGSAFRQDTTVASNVVLALGTTFGTCASDSDFGSRVNLIKKQSRTAGALAGKYSEEAVAHLVAQKRIRSVVGTGKANGAVLETVLSYVEASTSKRHDERILT